MEHRALIDETKRELRRRLAIEIEDARALRFLFVRTRDQTKGAGSVTHGRVWRLPANFSVPCPAGTRPRSALGRTTFHFEYSYVTKAAGGSKVVSANKVRFVAGNAAEEHHQYVKKGAFKCAEAMFAAYARDLPDRLSVVPEGLAWCGRSGTRTLWWSAEEGYFTNIGRDPDVVDSYWPAVYLSERIAGLPILRVKPAALPRDAWLSLAQNPSAPVQADAMFEAAAAVLIGGATNNQQRLLKQGVRVTDEEVQQVLNLLPPGAATRRNSPIVISSGRGGRTQYCLVAELPAELNDTARARIAREFCDSLNALGVMIEAVIHKPDHDNDHRNYHLHVIYHDRPAEYLEKAGCWDFEDREAVRGRSGRSRPMRRKVKLDRWEGVSGGDAGAALVGELRNLWADINNRQLVLAGKYPRYDPRTYAEMGIEQDPAEHLDKNAARLSNAGVAVAGDISNGEKYWTAEWRRRSQRLATDKERRAELASAAVNSIFYDTASCARQENIIGEFKAAAEELNQLEGALLLPDLYEDMARSRAVRTKTVALRLLGSLGGQASARSERDTTDIAERGQKATQWLAEVDDVVEPLAASRRRRQELRDSVREFTARLQPLVADGNISTLINPKVSDALAGASEDPDARLSRLFNRITVENLPVVPGRDGRVSAETVLGLDAADAAFLGRYHVRGFLAQRFEYQERELGRLRAYRRKNPLKFQALLLPGGGGGVPKAVRTLLERHGRHPEVDTWRRAALCEADRLEAAAEEQRKRERAAAAAQQQAEERPRLEAFLAKIEKHHWEILPVVGGLSVGTVHLENEGVVKLVRTSLHEAWLQGRYVQIAARQHQMRSRVLDAIAALAEVKFEFGGVSPASFASDVQPVFRATRYWVQVATALQVRVEQIERAAMDEIAPLLRSRFVRLKRIANSPDYIVPTGSLPARQTHLLTVHGASPSVKSALRHIGAHHEELYRALKVDIDRSGIVPVDADGILDPARVSREFAGAAQAWKADAALAQLLKEKLQLERLAVKASLEAIEKEDLSFEAAGIGWNFDTRLSLLERLRLASPPHRRLVREGVTAIMERRDSRTRAAAEQAALKQRESEQRDADARARQAERAAQEQALEARRKVEQARAQQRQAQELVHANERRAIDVLLKRIAIEGLPFEKKLSGWKVDARLTDSQHELLNLPQHADYVEAELQAVGAERELLAAAGAQACTALKQAARRRLDAAIERIKSDSALHERRAAASIENVSATGCTASFQGVPQAADEGAAPDAVGPGRASPNTQSDAAPENEEDVAYERLLSLHQQSRGGPKR